MKKMRFNEDKFYNFDLIYQKGQVYEIPDEMVMRWLKRGGEIVEDVPEEIKPLPVEADVAPVIEPGLPEPLEEEEEKVDDSKSVAKKGKKLKRQNFGQRKF